jgi:hypothetical protein
MSRFETEVLARPESTEGLADLSGKWIDRVIRRKRTHEIILDMDSSVSETYGAQEGSAYNGHFGCTCYHPLFCFNQFGDLERAMLRPGNVHSADDWRSVLEPVVARYRDRDIRRFFRGDAAFACAELYSFLEGEGYLYAMRLPANAVLQREIAHLLTRPVGRPPREPIIWSGISRMASGPGQSRAFSATVPRSGASASTFLSQWSSNRDFLVA